MPGLIPAGRECTLQPRWRRHPALPGMGGEALPARLHGSMAAPWHRPPAAAGSGASPAAGSEADHRLVEH